MLSNVLLILLGAGLVSVGFLGAALAGRIRDPRASRMKCDGCGHAWDQDADAARDLLHRREPSSPAELREPKSGERRLIPVVDPAELIRAKTTATATKSPRVPHPEPKAVASTAGGEDVIAALVAAGYKKPIATEATWACTADERATIERWTAAALRRCARGGAS
jgi:hypothetical protein